MFLNQIKNFFIQNKIKKSLSNVKPETSNLVIKTIGIIYDATSNNKQEALIKQLVANGIKESDITTLLYKDKIYKNEIFDTPSFSNKDLSWSGSFNNADVNYFVGQKFDLLVNYYDSEKLPLILTSNLSKASFKVGFSEIDKRLNHIIINTTTEKYAVFVAELFKYLKILKKT